MPASQNGSIRSIRSMKDGKPIPPPRFESKPTSDTTSLLSVWLQTYDLSSRPATPCSERTNDSIHHSVSGLKDTPAATCCMEAREAMERNISRKAIRTFAVLETSLDQLFEKLNRIDERLQRIERHQRQTRKKPSD